MKAKLICLILCVVVFCVSISMMFNLVDLRNAGANANGNMTATDEPATDETATVESGADSVFTRDTVIKIANEAEQFITRLAVENDKEYKESLPKLIENLGKAGEYLSSEQQDADGAAYFTGLAALFKGIIDTPFADASSFSSRVSLMLSELDGIYPTAAAAAAEADTENEIKMHYPKFDTSENGSFVRAMLAIYNRQKLEDKNAVTVSFGGNLVLGDYISNTSDSTFASQYAEYGSTGFPLYGLTPVFSADTLSIVNLQSPLTSSNSMTNGISAIKGDPTYAQMLKDGGVELAELTGSHMNDYGDEGIADTVKVLSELEIFSCTAKENSNIAYFESDKAKIAVVSYNMIGAKSALVDQPKADIQTARDNGAKIVVAAFNWAASGSADGLYNTEVDNILPKTARAAIDNGADLVLGSGPHVIMGMEKYTGQSRSGTIVYSPGDISYAGQKDAGLAGDRGFIFSQTFTLDGDSVTAATPEIYPIKTSELAPSLVFDSSATAVRDEIVNNSKIINKKYRVTADDLSVISISKTK